MNEWHKQFNNIVLKIAAVIYFILVLRSLKNILCFHLKQMSILNGWPVTLIVVPKIEK